MNDIYRVGPIPLASVCAIIDKLRVCDIWECNGNYQRLVASRILATGKPVESLTLGELGDLITTATKDFNAAWERAHANG